MKKKILFIAAVVVVLSILAAGTLAYFTSRTVVHNVITTSGVEIDIVEWQQDGDELVPYPDEPMAAMPGTTLSKIVTVENNDAEAYIRARFEIVVTDGNGKVMDLTQEELSKVISVTMPNGSGWQQKPGDTQWWYYVNSVDTGDATEALFTEVVFDGPNMTNEYQNCTVEVIVYAEGVQTANNGKTALEAAGWPA